MQGAIFSGVDVRDYEAVFTASMFRFPKEFELKTIRVKNQENVGSCVAHSLSSIIEYYNTVQNNDTTEMSVGYIYGNRRTSKHKGVGMIVRDALDTVRKYGDVPKEDFPYNVEVPLATTLYEDNSKNLFEHGYPHRINNYCRLRTNNAIKFSLMSGNPVLFAMKWYSDMKVVDGILTTSYQGYDGGHCMFIYGWNEIGWKVQNSWGERWGVNGTVIIPYDIKIEEAWTLIDNIIEGVTIKKPFSSNVGKYVAKIINRLYTPFNVKT